MANTASPPYQRAFLGCLLALFLAFYFFLNSVFFYDPPRYIDISMHSLNGNVAETIAKPLKGLTHVKIPSIVHHMWKTGAPSTALSSSGPPSATVRWIKGCQQINTHYRFQMFNDAELLHFTETFYPKYLPLFKSLKGVYMADMARILLTYHFGGIYMDLDFYCHRPFDCLLSRLDQLLASSSSKYNVHPNFDGSVDVLIVSLEPKVHANIFRGKNRVIIQDFFMATPKHPFLAWLLDDRLAKFLADPTHPVKGPFSYAIEKDIDDYREYCHLKHTSKSKSLDSANSGSSSSSSSSSNSRSTDGNAYHFSYTNTDIVEYEDILSKQSFVHTPDSGFILELKENVLHPLVDATNPRLVKKCTEGFPQSQALRNTADSSAQKGSATEDPSFYRESCALVTNSKFFNPSPQNTIAVHMWTHVYLGWHLIRGLYSWNVYRAVESALPASKECY